ncbi:MAG: hypothetical protein MJ247_04275 [Alphaproteobacteria bacterium]|nr:hypothetical protein [Alphaproteobacteria bacterium]
MAENDEKKVGVEKDNSTDYAPVELGRETKNTTRNLPDGTTVSEEVVIRHMSQRLPDDNNVEDSSKPNDVKSSGKGGSFTENNEVNYKQDVPDDKAFPDIPLPQKGDPGASVCDWLESLPDFFMNFGDWCFTKLDRNVFAAMDRKAAIRAHESKHLEAYKKGQSSARENLENKDKKIDVSKADTLTFENRKFGKPKLVAIDGYNLTKDDMKNLVGPDGKPFDIKGKSPEEISEAWGKLRKERLKEEAKEKAKEGKTNPKRQKKTKAKDDNSNKGKGKSGKGSKSGKGAKGSKSGKDSKGEKAGKETKTSDKKRKRVSKPHETKTEKKTPEKKAKTGLQAAGAKSFETNKKHKDKARTTKTKKSLVNSGQAKVKALTNSKKKLKNISNANKRNKQQARNNTQTRQVAANRNNGARG